MKAFDPGRVALVFWRRQHGDGGLPFIETAIRAYGRRCFVTGLAVGAGLVSVLGWLLR